MDIHNWIMDIHKMVILQKRVPKCVADGVNLNLQFLSFFTMYT